MSFNKSQQFECPAWLMDHIKRVVPDIQTINKIDGKWPDKVFILPRLDNELIADWVAEAPLKSSELVVMLLPTWSNQFWYKWVSHECDKFNVAGEITFEGEAVPFPGGMVLAIYRNSLPMINYLLTLPRNPVALGGKPEEVGFDASFYQQAWPMKTQRYFEHGTIENIATPVEHLIECDRKTYAANYDVNTAEQTYRAVQHQEQRLKHRLWEKKNPEKAALKRFESQIETLLSGFYIDEEEISKLLSSNNGDDAAYLREFTIELTIENGAALDDDIETLGKEISKAKATTKKNDADSRFIAEFEALQKRVKTIPAIRDSGVIRANELLVILNAMDELKKKHQTEMEALVKRKDCTAKTIKPASIRKTVIVSSKPKQTKPAPITPKNDVNHEELKTAFLTKWKALQARRDTTKNNKSFNSSKSRLRKRYRDKGLSIESGNEYECH